MTTQELVNKLKNEFPQMLREIDTNRDGTVDQNELLQLLMTRYCIPWACAANMVAEVFYQLDKNRDCRLSISEVQNNCGCFLPYVETIRLVCPAEGTVFCHFPRTTFLSWTPMATACVYQVEVQFQSCGSWQPLVTERTPQPCFQTQFVGAQPGRWQVTALDAQGQKIGQSEWRTFVYRV